MKMVKLKPKFDEDFLSQLQYMVVPYREMVMIYFACCHFINRRIPKIQAVSCEIVIETMEKKRRIFFIQE